MSWLDSWTAPPAPSNPPPAPTSSWADDDPDPSPPAPEVILLTLSANSRWTWTAPGFEGIADQVDRAKAAPAHAFSELIEFQRGRRLHSW